jgi:hypothetical protein
MDVALSGHVSISRRRFRRRSHTRWAANHPTSSDAAAISIGAPSFQKNSAVHPAKTTAETPMSQPTG